MPKRILIAEDDATAREVLAKHFKGRGYKVVTADNGIRLLAASTREKFDVIVTDIMMPDLNGVASTDVMKFKGDTTPIIALTGLSPQDIASSKDRFSKVFHKPVDINALLEYVESLLRE